MYTEFLINEGCDVCFFKLSQFLNGCNIIEFTALHPVVRKARACQGGNAPGLVARHLGTVPGTGASVVSVRLLFL